MGVGLLHRPRVDHRLVLSHFRVRARKSVKINQRFNNLPPLSNNK